MKVYQFAVHCVSLLALIGLMLAEGIILALRRPISSLGLILTWVAFYVMAIPFWAWLIPILVLSILELRWQSKAQLASFKRHQEWQERMEMPEAERARRSYWGE